MIKTTVYCNDSFSLNAVYRFSNFLNSDYLNVILNKTEELTVEDVMNKRTNVKANMTSYTELLNHEEYRVFCNNLLQVIDFIMRLRNSESASLQYTISGLWGMRHKKGDYSQMHSHFPHSFSGAFYLKVPGTTKINFPEFNVSELLEENCLYIFTGSTNHGVDYQEYEGNRISIAFNIDIEKV